MKSLLPKTINHLFCKHSSKSHKTAMVIVKLPGDVIKFAGYAIPNKGKKAEHAVAIKSLLADGVRPQKVAEILDMSLSYVYKLSKSSGLS